MLPRARAHLSAHALTHNLEELSRLAGVPLLLPVKANAYGHGLAQVVQVTRELPSVWGYAVATPIEAAELCALRPGKPVLLLTPADVSETLELSDLGVLLGVSTPEEVRALPNHARVHLKVDTGMNRLGVRPEQAAELGQLLTERGQLAGLCL